MAAKKDGVEPVAEAAGAAEVQATTPQVTQAVEVAPEASSGETQSGPAQDEPVALPESVVLSALYGFADDDGGNRFWTEGMVVTDQTEIALLIARKAPLDGIEYED